MTSRIGVSRCDNSDAITKKLGGEMGGSLLALLAALEGSLEQSRKALASLDIAGLRTRTQQQVLLGQKVAAMLDEAGGTSDAWPVRAASEEELKMGRLRMVELRVAAERICMAIRVQSALLARSQAKLRVMANMLASPSMSYGPMLAARLRTGQQA